MIYKKDNINYEELLDKLRKFDALERNREKKKRSLFQRIFRPTPDELIEEFGIRF